MHMLDPPDKAMLVNMSLLKSISGFLIDQFMHAALPIREQRARGIHFAQDLGLEEGRVTVIAWPSGTLKVLSEDVEHAAVLISLSKSSATYLLDTLIDLPQSIRLAERDLPFSVWLSMSWPARSSWLMASCRMNP